ncbi:hypothetical protein C8J57DRAFT_1529872 [Mycena rebaudengoi]|nr:hypothetical protein C8J57DRAFT_1529872 [Mycena rebaudengoi]
MQYSSRTTDVLRVLTHCITVSPTPAPAPAPAPATTAHPIATPPPKAAPATYVQALSAGSLLPLTHNTSQHPMSSWLTPSPSPPPVDPPPPRTPVHCRANTHNPDVIIQLDLLSTPVEHRSREVKIFGAISDALEGIIRPVSAISGVHWMRTGNLALQVDPEGSPVESIISHAQVIWVAIHPLLGFTDQQRRPRFEDSNPWRLVVFLWVPVNGRSKKQLGSLSSVQAWLGLGGTNSPVRTVSVLCQDENLVGKRYVSLHVYVVSDTEAQHLVDDGDHLFGTWCKASHYSLAPAPSHSQSTE